MPQTEVTTLAETIAQIEVLLLTEAIPQTEALQLQDKMDILTLEEVLM
jgi:hypothetical protein